MSSAVIQLLVLAGVAIFLILRLKNVLGTREGFEKPTIRSRTDSKRQDDSRPALEVIEGGPDHDIIDHVDENSSSARALSEMKKTDPAFRVGEFLEGARGAYEMILMAFEHGDIADVEAFLSEEVRESFAAVIAERQEKGLTIDANIVGIRETKLAEVTFDADTKDADLTVRFVAELTSVVKGSDGEVIEGSSTEIKRQRDVWTFSRVMGTDDPNWLLVATGE